MGGAGSVAAVCGISCSSRTNAEAAEHDRLEKKAAEAKHQRRQIERHQEWRIWFVSTDETRTVVEEVYQRMEAFISSLQAVDVPFFAEDTRIDQYFCVDPTIDAKIATRGVEVHSIVERLCEVSEQGTEAWAELDDGHISTYSSRPYVSLQKKRYRCSTARSANGDRFEGLMSLEKTEVRVVGSQNHSPASSVMQKLQHDVYFTIALEGLPKAIALAIQELRLEEAARLALVNPDVSNPSLLRLNISYPRFLHLVSVPDVGHAHDSETEDTHHEKDHGVRPEEWRLWLPDSPVSRAALAQMRERMNGLVAEFAPIGDKKNSAMQGLTAEGSRVDQYFCAGPSVGPKAATRDGKVDMEVKELVKTSGEGSEFWKKATGVDLTQYTKLPWVSLEKVRSRCKLKQLAQGTDFHGLKALEITEIKVVKQCIFLNGTGSRQNMKSDAYLTVAVEGTPSSIVKAVIKLQLQELASQLEVLKNDNAKGLGGLNVSYPRFIHLASGAAERADMIRNSISAAAASSSDMLVDVGKPCAVSTSETLPHFVGHAQSQLTASLSKNDHVHVVMGVGAGELVMASAVVFAFLESERSCVECPGGPTVYIPVMSIPRSEMGQRKEYSEAFRLVGIQSKSLLCFDEVPLANLASAGRLVLTIVGHKEPSFPEELNGSIVLTGNGSGRAVDRGNGPGSTASLIAEIAGAAGPVGNAVLTDPAVAQLLGIAILLETDNFQDRTKTSARDRSAIAALKRVPGASMEEWDMHYENLKRLRLGS